MKVYRYNSSRVYVRVLFAGMTSALFSAFGIFVIVGPIVRPEMFSGPIAVGVCGGAVMISAGLLFAWTLYASNRPIAFPPDGAIARHIIFGKWKVIPWSEVTEVRKWHFLDRSTQKYRTLYRITSPRGSLSFSDEISGIRTVLMNINSAVVAYKIRVIDATSGKPTEVSELPVSRTSLEQLAGATPEEPAPLKW